MIMSGLWLGKGGEIGRHWGSTRRNNPKSPLPNPQSPIPNPQGFVNKN